jgi:hypothetical protein
MSAILVLDLVRCVKNVLLRREAYMYSLQQCGQRTRPRRIWQIYSGKSPARLHGPKTRWPRGRRRLLHFRRVEPRRIFSGATRSRSPAGEGAFLPIAIANAAGAAFGAPPLLLKLATSAWALPRPRACDSQPHNGEDDEEFAAAAAVISRHHHFCRGGGDAGDRRKAVHSLSTGLERPRSDAPNGLALVRIPPRSPRSSPTARTHWPRRLTLRCCYCCCCLGLLVEYCVSA